MTNNNEAVKVLVNGTQAQYIKANGNTVSNTERGLSKDMMVTYIRANGKVGRSMGREEKLMNLET